MWVGEKETTITFDKKQQFIQNFPPICIKIQCSLDIATGLRQGDWGRYRQRGRYIKDLKLEKGAFLYINIGYSDLSLDIATDSGRHLLNRSRNLRSL